MTNESRKSLKEVVGQDTYAVWIDMLRVLVPDGRTHRLAQMIAGMLQFALEKSDSRPDEGSVAHDLLVATESSDPDEAFEILCDVMEQLFRDAKVKHKRTSSRGEAYSIAEQAVWEFINWYAMPWE